MTTVFVSGPNTTLYLKKRHLILLCLSVLSVLMYSSAPAQQNNIWYFGGRSGLDFSPGPVVPRPLNNSAMVAKEGSSTICDDDGNVLFYTNGVTVYNRNHLVMLNGDQIGGHTSAFQSSIIIPHPGDKNLYYIFTADAVENGFANGYRYSIVDIRGDGGNGEVVTKNSLLVAPGTERLAAVRHANGIDVWLITNDINSNIFRSWLINCNGLLFSSTVSAVGDPMDSYPTMNVGVMKVSPDGKMLCHTHFPDVDVATGSPFDYFQLFDFDNATGIISNPRKVLVPTAKYISADFSPNSQYIYLPRRLFTDQFNVKLPTVTDIVNSRVSMPASANIWGVQLAPDGKIYLSPQGNFLDVISNPDNPGLACNYEIKKLELLNPADIGLPAYINDISVSPYNNLSYDILDSCTGRIQFYGNSNLTGTLSWNWDFGDGNTSTLQNPVHTYALPKQSYLVRLTITSLTGCGTVIKSKTIFPSGVAFTKPNFNFFGGCDSGYVRFEIVNPVETSPNLQYIWDFGDGNTSTQLAPKHVYAMMGAYDVKLKIKTTTPCLDDSITIRVDMGDLSGITSITPDQVIFNGQSIRLFAQGPGNIYEWTPATALSNPSVQRPVASPTSDITYTVKISNIMGCFVERSVKITVVDLDSVYVPTGFTPNNDGRNDLLRPIFGTKFTLKQFSVYNRWGQQVYTTSQGGAGWDGKLQGILQETGVYVWILKITNEAGILIEKKGTAILIR